MSSRSSYRRALDYFRDDTARVILSLSMIGLGVAANVASPLPMMVLVDSVLFGNKVDRLPHRMFESIKPADKLSQILLLAGIMLGLRLLGELLQMLQTIVSIKIGYNGTLRVRQDLFRKLQSLSLAYHRSQPQGDAIYRLSSDTNGFGSVLNVVTKGILVNAVTLVFMAIVMFSMNWKLTLAALTVVPALLFTIKYYGKKFKVLYTKSYEYDSNVTTAIQRSVSSIGIVQAFGREKDEFDNFVETQGSSFKFKMTLHWHEVLYWLWLGTIFAVGSAVIVGYGGYLALNYPAVFTTGMLLTFLGYLSQLYAPLSALTGTGASLAGAMAQVDRVIEVLDRDPVIKDAPDAINLPKKARVLAFQDVGFEYRQGVPILQGVNATISPGQMVAFVGSSGVGKTTLLNLLPRFYDPTTGTMSLDGTDARKIKVADLRKHVALVLQDNVILPTTVAENISYGRPDATDAQIRHAAEIAGAAGFIDNLEHKYETPISESGSNLSGGQKQRISIARALLTEAPIMVLDEPTSALDPHHEQMITETLRSLKRQRTIILVSHRLSTVADCDQIFVMHEGRIVEQGTHDELVAKRGMYFSMAKHQMKIDDTEEVKT
jgi:ABC-type multidrug transport system fused ATPase/permease subunit